MPPLGPGIRKHQVKYGDGSWRKEIMNCIRAFHSDDPRVVEFLLRDLSAGATCAAKQAFDPEKIACRILTGQGHQKCAIAATDVDFHRSHSPENAIKIERCEIVLRHKL